MLHEGSDGRQVVGQAGCGRAELEMEHEAGEMGCGIGEVTGIIRGEPRLSNETNACCV